MDIQGNALWFILIYPVAIVVMVALNVVLKARSGRSLKLRVKGFGVDLLIESSDDASTVGKPSPKDASTRT